MNSGFKNIVDQEKARRDEKLIAMSLQYDEGIPWYEDAMNGLNRMPPSVEHQMFRR